MRISKAFILCLSFFIFLHSASGQIWKKNKIDNIETENDAITRYTISNGLPSRNTTTVIKDKKGFIWVGTENGLCQFDGYKFKTFINKKGDSTSISNNFINALIEDRLGRIWVGTMDGLNIFDPNTEKFTRFYHNELKKTSLSNNKIWSLLADRYNHVWIGTDDGFNLFVERSKSFKTYRPEATNRYAMKGKSVNAIIEDANYLWLGNWGEGLNKFDIKTDKFYNFKQAFPSTEKSPNDIWTLCKDENGLIWIGTYWKGLYVFNPATQTFKSCNNQATNNQSVFTLLNIDKNTLLVGGNENFWWVKTSTNTWTKIGSIENNPHGHAYRDRDGLIWVSSKNGLSKIDQKQHKFSFLPLAERQSEITGMLIKDSTLWLGTNKGLIEYDFKAGRSSILRHTQDPKSLGNDQIRKIYRDDSGKMWVLTEYGFDEFDDISRTFKHHYHHSALGSLFNEDVFRDILEIEPGIYGLATDAGFKIFDSHTGQFRHYFNRNDQPYTISNNHLNCLLKDKDNNIWIGTTGGGLNRFDSRTGKFRTYLSNDKSEGSISENIIQSLFQDSHGDIWICTPDGLDQYIKKTDSFITYSKNDGFASNVFNDIVEDRNGNLWITTEKGISTFNPRTNAIRNFDDADGTFVNSAIFRDKDGGIYLAGYKGLEYFNPLEMKQNREIPPVFISDFQIFNKSIDATPNGPLKENLNNAKEVTLDYTQSVFSIDFVALNYTLPEKNQYAYMLEGFDKKWNFAGTQHKATYTNLDPGSYTFRVKAANNDGVWNREGKMLTIVITPPWYKTWYAYVFYLLMIGCVIYGYVKYRENQAKLRYEIKLAHLQSEQEKELNEKKLSFFTHISHEFRTPLTLIINPLKELLYKEKEVDASSINIIYRNARRLLGLVDQLLLFRKTEAGVEKLKVSKLNVADLSKEVFLCFSYQAKSKNIQFDFQCCSEQLELYADREKFEIVLFNLLANALKFTPEGGKVKLAIVEDKKHIGIEISDSGCGIPEGTGDKLYTRFYQEQTGAKNGQGGFGIGLFLVKNFVERHKGIVRYDSDPGKGTVFYIQLLKGADHFSSEILIDDEMSISNGLKELIEDEISVNSVVEEANELLAESDLNSELKSILIIDDNKDFREYLKQVFKIDYRVYEASDGLTGLEMIRQVLPEIVISDVMMDGMSGIELCALVREDMSISHIPLILLTSSSSLEIKLKGLEGGADDYISKPFDKDILKARVAGILKSKNNLQKYFYNEITLNKNPHKISIEYKRFLENCINIVEKHLTDPDFNIQILASELAISHSSLYKKIKFISGQSASSFIRSIRLRKAAHIFINTNYNILETSYQVGINDIKYFREQFKKLFNMNPSQYIKKYRKTFSSELVHHEVNRNN
ncbi:MAG: two-component regulator propeller domain-containing protein [Mucilaginibacter sp.]